MKKILVFVLIFVSLFSQEVYSQVPNDDWKNAIDLGWLNKTRHSNYSWYLYDPDTVVIGSNINSLPNFPFLYQANCSNSLVPLNTLTIPTNDVWYKFKASVVFTFALADGQLGNYLDTVQMNVWIGNHVSGLHPIQCFAEEYGVHSSVDLGAVNVSDSIYLQISGNRINKVGNFRIEVRGSVEQLWGTMTYNTTPDILCMSYTKSTTNATEPTAADGTAAVTVTAGNAPYTYLWSTGSTDSVCTDLLAGTYYVSITDVGGCVQQDSVEVKADTNVVSVRDFQNEMVFSVYPNPAKEFFEIELDMQEKLSGNILLYNSLGTLVLQNALRLKTNKQQINGSNLPSGVYSIRIETETKCICGRVVIMR